MNFKKADKLTYKSYLKEAWYNKDMTDEKEVMDMAKRLKNVSAINSPVMPMFYIIDYTKSSYLLMSEAIKNVSNYDPKEFLEGGLQKTLDIYHHDDFKVYNQKIFKKNLEVLKSVPQEEHEQLVFTYNFRIRCKDNRIANFLQKGFYLTDKQSGLPKYSIGAITDVTNVYLKDNLITHLVEHNSIENNINKNEILIKDYFYSGEENNLLTKQELIVLLCLVDGLNSKAIAQKLKCSAHTVNNHRQNMMIKTNTKNVTQLILHAVKNKLI